MDYSLFLCSEVYTKTLFRLQLPWDEGKEKEEKVKKKKKKTSSLDDTTVGEQQHLSSQHAWRDHESITLPSSPFPALPDMVARDLMLGSRSKEGSERPIRIPAHTGKQGERLMHTPRSRGSAIAQLA